MFDGIKQFFRRIYSMIFPVKSVAEAFQIDIPVNSEMTKAISRWNDMYLNKHSTLLPSDYKSMSLPAAISSELARLVTIEMKSEITSGKNKPSKRAEFLNRCYQPVVDQLRRQTEYAAAMGGIIMKPFLDEKRVAVEFVQANKFLPLSFNSAGEITACVFTDVMIIDKKRYTRLELHELVGTTYYVTNKAYKKSMNDLSDTLGEIISLQSVEPWKDLSDEVTLENIDRPLFSYFRIPMANIIDPGSHLGVSVYSKAENLIAQADDMWNMINWEYKSKETALDVSESMIPRDGKLPEKEKRLFRKHIIDNKTDESFYQVFSPEIRDSSFYNGLNKILQRIEFNCGLAYGTISDVQEVEKTAEEIKGSKQRSYATVSDIQKSLEEALEHLIYAMNTYADLYSLSEKGEYGTSYEWDDSIIVDAKSESAIMMQEVAAGMIKPEIYLMRRYGLTEEQAKEMMPSANTTQTDNTEDDGDA